MSLDAIYAAYWSLLDPLCQSQSLPVVRALAGDGRRMGLVTFEQEPWALEPAALAATRKALQQDGILWMPLRYHKQPRLLATVFDVLHGAWVCSRTGRHSGVRLFHGRGTVAAALAHLSARLNRARFFNDADGPLSEEYADAGVWRFGSVEYRLTRRVERRLLRVADAVAVLTTYRRDQVKALASCDATILPCAVDTDRFNFREDDRRARRLALGLRGHVLVFAGRASGWYPTEPILDFASAAVQVFGDTSLLVLTNDDAARFTSGAVRRGFRCIVRRAAHDEVPGLLSAGDVGLSLRLAAPSAAAASPVKNGEYLACGLPVVTTPGIGDYSDLVRRRSVGVVVSRFDPTGFGEATSALAQLLQDPGLRQRCRDAAVSEVSLAGVVLPRYRRLYGALLGARPGTRS
jgi:glycosyltransferase involved in cell wall biosynthesis